MILRTPPRVCSGCGALAVILLASYKFDSGSDGEAIYHFGCRILEELQT